MKQDGEILKTYSIKYYTVSRVIRMYDISNYQTWWTPYHGVPVIPFFVRFLGSALIRTILAEMNEGSRKPKKAGTKKPAPTHHPPSSVVWSTRLDSLTASLPPDTQSLKVPLMQKYVLVWMLVNNLSRLPQHWIDNIKSRVTYSSSIRSRAYSWSVTWEVWINHSKLHSTYQFRNLLAIDFVNWEHR